MLAADKKATKPEGQYAAVEQGSLGTVKFFGRTYDLGAMMLYKLGTSTYLKDTEKFPMMLKKGKIALLPPRGADRKTVKRIFKKYGESEGTKMK